MLVSIAIPCYRSAKTIGEVVGGIDRVFQESSEHDYEIILVNDGSPDNTFEVIYEICQKNEKVIGVNLSKNFGQSAAKMAAIPYVHGQVLVYMDDDGQHPVDGIFQLVQEIKKGNDIVYAYFPEKKHNAFKRITSALHGKILSLIGSKPKDVKLSSFLAISEFAIQTLQQSDCPVIATTGYLRKLTNKITNVEMQHLERKSGASGYSLKKMLNMWKRVITSFNTKLLELATVLGVASGASGFIGAIIIFVRKLIYPNVQTGYTSTIVFMLIMNGMIMFLLGIMGEYIGRMYLILGKLPPYKVREVVSKNNEERIINIDESTLE